MVLGIWATMTCDTICEWCVEWSKLDPTVMTLYESCIFTMLTCGHVDSPCCRRDWTSEEKCVGASEMT